MLIYRLQCPYSAPTVPRNAAHSASRRNGTAHDGADRLSEHCLGLGRLPGERNPHTTHAASHARSVRIRPRPHRCNTFDPASLLKLRKNGRTTHLRTNEVANGRSTRTTTIAKTTQVFVGGADPKGQSYFCLTLAPIHAFLLYTNNGRVSRCWID